MLRKISKFLQRMELASDAMVLEKIPQSPQADKVRKKHAEKQLVPPSRKNVDPDFALRLASESAKACHAIQELAKLGDPEGMFHLGDMYQNGFGVEMDLDEAVRLYKVSARAGFAPAQTRLGNAYFEGSFVGQSYREAFRWYTLGAEGGDDVCQKNLGLMYLNGIGAEENREAALKWLLASAEHGNYIAQRNLAKMHLTGNGVVKNKSEALKWFLIAEKCGDPEALDAWSQLVLDVSPADSRRAVKAADQYSKKIQ